jgi:hypothetical protein
MTRYLIEVAHENSKEACDRAVRIFMQTGFHFMTNADWGCSDGVHKAWFIVETGSKDEALSLLPSLIRQSATIIALERFRPEDFAGLRGEHEG